MIRASLAFALADAFLSGCDSASGSTGVLPSVPPASTSSSPVTYTVPSTTPSPVACSGYKIGTYSWSQTYWRSTNDTTLLDFLDSSVGRNWACADLSINIADYSNPDQIHDSEMLVNFIQNHRMRIRNPDTVIWLTYGDVVEKSSEKMIAFTRTFFNWASSIPADVAASMGTIGISYDVEHIDPEATKTALQLSQQLRSSTNFSKILIQHTIEGDPNVVGTDYVMKYADSALAMAYRNYIHDPTGHYQDDSNLVNRILWMLTSQCPNCLNDDYASANYKAKISVMVEASCQMGASCGKASFCAFDSDSQGAEYMYEILTETNDLLVSGGHITRAQSDRLFSKSTPFTVHNWEWYRCYAPFSKTFTYDTCLNYHNYAASCRTQ